MREIKFKSYVKHNGIIKCIVWNPFDEKSTPEALELVVGELLAYGLQFTGLNDKNGNPIYEGDLVSYTNAETTSTENGMDCDEFPTIGEMYWDDQSAQWDVRGRIDVTRDEVFDAPDFEVMGNKFQNPELCQP